MKRKILFQSGSIEIPLKTKTSHAKTISKPQESPFAKVELSGQQKSERLYKWLKSHPLVNLNGVCKKVGVDRANFLKMGEKGKELKPEIIQSFVNILKEYGYAAV